MQCTRIRTSYGANVGSLPATPTPDSAMLAAVTAITKPLESIPFAPIAAKTNESFKVEAPASCLVRVGAAMFTGTGSRRHSIAWAGGSSIADAGMHVRACLSELTSCTCGVPPESITDMRDSAVVTNEDILDVITAGLCALICFSSHGGVNDDCRSSLTMRLWSVIGRILRKPSPFEPMTSGMVVPVFVWN